MILDVSFAGTAEGTEIAVRITNADRCDARRPAGTVGRTIANGHGTVNVADLKDFCMQLNDLSHRIRLAGERGYTVERRARTDLIEVVRRA